MGYDISNHAIDVRFVQDRLVPAVKGQGHVDDFLDRAARMAVVAHRAKRWGLRVVDLSHQISDRQRALERHERTAPPPPPTSSWWRTIRRAISASHKATAEPAREPLRFTTGLPGFDSDLSVWGRPFFVTEDGSDAALSVVERYMACDAADAGSVDAIAREQIALLAARRSRVRDDVHADGLAVLEHFYPIDPHLEKPTEDEEPLPEMASVRSHAALRFDLLRSIWAARNDDSDTFEHQLLDAPAAASALVRELPYSLIGLAAQVLPGWMGRGYVWPTALFEKIGVGVGDLFETPAALFAPMLRDVPSLAQSFDVTIPQNYSLGGYVPPQRVAALEALLLKHRRDLILAWQDDKSASDADVEACSNDFTKIIEPVTWARHHGHGFIEGAEIYSGFLGALN